MVEISIVDMKIFVKNGVNFRMDFDLVFVIFWRVQIIISIHEVDISLFITTTTKTTTIEMINKINHFLWGNEKQDGGKKKKSHI